MLFFCECCSIFCNIVLFGYSFCKLSDDKVSCIVELYSKPKLKINTVCLFIQNLTVFKNSSCHTVWIWVTNSWILLNMTACVSLLVCSCVLLFVCLPFSHQPHQLLAKLHKPFMTEDISWCHADRSQHNPPVSSISNTVSV